MKPPEYYRQKHRAVYKGGYCNQTISLSLEAKQKLEDAGIVNLSLFINDLLLQSLHQKAWEKGQFSVEIQELRKRAESYGLELFVREPEKEYEKTKQVLQPGAQIGSGEFKPL